MSHTLPDYPASGPDTGLVKDITPAVAETLPAGAIMASLKRLYDRARRHRVRSTGLAGALQGCVFADNCQSPSQNGSNGTDTATNSRVAQVAGRGASLLRVVAPNFTLGESTSGLTDLTVRASIEYPSGTFTPVYFGGLRDVIVSPGSQGVSNPIGVYIPAGATFWTRTFVTTSSGGKWPVGIAPTYAGGLRSSGFESGATGVITDKTTSGTIAGQFAFGYAGFAVSVDPGSSVAPSVAILGDSIATGQGDNNADIYSPGFIIRALGAVSIPWLRMSLSGEQANADFSRRESWASACSHAICQHGTNDVTLVTATVLQARLVAMWFALFTQGITVFHTTITPRSTSTDSWATTTNQTTAASNSVRVTVNDWIRDGAPILNGVAVATGSSANGTVRAGAATHPLSGYFEVADTVESARNSGIWKAGYSGDGIHPTPTGHTAAAVAIDTTRITL